MPFLGRILLALSVALALAVGGVNARTAWAQNAPLDDPAAKKRAGKFLKAGDSLIKKGDKYAKRKRKRKKAVAYYERALEAYQRAFDIYPKPQIYWLIGLAEQKLGRNLDALRHYQQLITEVPTLPAALETQLELQMSEAKQHVVTLMFNVLPESAVISVDGEDIGEAPYTEALYLEPGEHTIAVSSSGHTPFEETVELEAGAESERTIKLAKIPVIVTAPRPKPVPEPKPEPGPSTMPLVLGVSATAGLGALATTMGLLAVSRHGTFTDESKAQDERDSAASSGKTFALVSDLLWVGTIAAGAYTAYHYIKVYKPKSDRYEERRKSGARALWITPYAAGRSAGVAAGGRF